MLNKARYQTQGLTLTAMANWRYSIYLLLAEQLAADINAVTFSAPDQLNKLAQTLMQLIGTGQMPAGKFIIYQQGLIDERDGQNTLCRSMKQAFDQATHSLQQSLSSAAKQKPIAAAENFFKELTFSGLADKTSAPVSRLTRQTCIIVNWALNANSASESAGCFITAADNVGNINGKAHKKLRQNLSTLEEEILTESSSYSENGFIKLIKAKLSQFAIAFNMDVRQESFRGLDEQIQQLLASQLIEQQLAECIKINYQREYDKISAELIINLRQYFINMAARTLSAADQAFIDAIGQEQFELFKNHERITIVVTPEIYRHVKSAVVRTSACVIKSYIPLCSRRHKFSVQLEQDYTFLPSFDAQRYVDRKIKVPKATIGAMMTHWIITLKLVRLDQIQRGKTPSFRMGKVGDGGTIEDYNHTHSTKQAAWAHASRWYLAARAAGFKHEEINFRESSRLNPRELYQSLNRVYDAELAQFRRSLIPTDLRRCRRAI